MTGLYQRDLTIPARQLVFEISGFTTFYPNDNGQKT
jgi:hypothetical protein